LEDTADVAAAKAKFATAYAAAEAGTPLAPEPVEIIAAAPQSVVAAPVANKVALVPVASSYLEDTADVAAAKAKFATAYAAAEAGTPLAPEPVEVIAAAPQSVVAAPVANKVELVPAVSSYLEDTAEVAAAKAKFAAAYAAAEAGTPLAPEPVEVIAAAPQSVVAEAPAAVEVGAPAVETVAAASPAYFYSSNYPVAYAHHPSNTYATYNHFAQPLTYTHAYPCTTAYHWSGLPFITATDKAVEV